MLHASAAFSQSLTEVIQGLKRVELDVASKAPKADTQGKVDACLRDLSSKTRELAAKASMHDVNTLLDGKADVDEVNAALLEINRQMNLKASLSEVSDTLREQALLNSALITELCLGRWIWKSLKTKHGGAVPWNMQTANSDPDNLLWEKDKAGITCVSPGLYEIQVCLKRWNGTRLACYREPCSTMDCVLVLALTLEKPTFKVSMHPRRPTTCICMHPSKCQMRGASLAGSRYAC